MKKIVLYIPLFLYMAICNASPAYAELLSIEQYISLKSGYTGTFVNPVKIKGSAINPNTGHTANTLLSTANLSVAIGTYYATEYVAVRGEIEYAIRFQSGKTIEDIPFTSGAGSLELISTIQTTLFNLYLDFNTTTFFVPYIGVGVGASFMDNKFSIPNYNNRELTIDFAWMGTVGGAFYIIPSVAIDLQVRYVSFGNSNYGSGDPARLLSGLGAVEALIGIRYTL